MTVVPAPRETDVVQPGRNSEVDPDLRNRMERRLALRFLTGMLAACAALLWLFYGAGVVRLLSGAGGMP
ncbi:MAG TPA: hypothetical protein PLO53_03475 [Candidatus Hydrogenedentes bacterium]|nr:hypothetical protein [Candidatus Hydrogenedentota bacterium]HPU96998.1 hypothetical protein [Candidatus Hydrogenedentota bacterium]